MPRAYETFSHKGARFRVWCRHADIVRHEVRRQRELLEAYIRRHPAFQASFRPVELIDGAPEVATRMARASAAVGVGPMAAVAGAMAQMAAEALARGGDEESIIDNGGDVFLRMCHTAIVGIHAGVPELSALGFRVRAEQTPLAVCSSSGRMGHSTSMGDCDLATVVAADGALADAAATHAANRVREEADIERALAETIAVPGVQGVLIVKGGRLGMQGTLPELVKLNECRNHGGVT